MKKIAELLTKLTFGMFFMGVVILLCGIGEFSVPLILVGGMTAVVGFVLTLLLFTIVEGMESKNVE